MVLEYSGEPPMRSAAEVSIAVKIGCAAHAPHQWIKKDEVDSGKRVGVPSDVAEKLMALKRENRELRQGNGIMCEASAYFTQAELDRLFKP